MAKKRPWNRVGTVASVLFMAMAVFGGIAVFKGAVAESERAAALADPGTALHQVPSTVTKLGSGKYGGNELHVSFETVEGTRVTTRVRTLQSNRGYSKGQQLDVVYAEQMPKAARLAVNPGPAASFGGTMALAVFVWMTAAVVAWRAFRDIWPKAKKPGSKKPRAPRRGRKARSGR
ncbi:hypothetical protein [Arthrobacter glacialis]|uniref:hypothetical protein n=1 Tax=Arthrobacter glacialis TaxID=1664 RepID=UPI000CD3F60D|nr:hypothetical protein [Arthrobacter glacialis]POH57013.1 hypothetical protein CVS28_18250 [Arthrobacter glacialis]